MPAQIITELDQKRFKRQTDRFLKLKPQNRKRGMIKGGALLMKSIRKKVVGDGFVRNPGRAGPYPGVLDGSVIRSLFVKVNGDGTFLQTGPQSRIAPHAVYLEFTMPQSGRSKVTKPFVKDSWDETKDDVFSTIFGAVIKPLRR